MVRTWKYWLSAAAVLLTVGAGCSGSGQEQATDEGQVQVQAPQPEAKTETKTEGGAEAKGTVDVDSAVDAAIKESDDDASASMETNGDADVLNNDSAELNAYGQAYVDSETR